jgi:hypothetical protein
MTGTRRSPAPVGPGLGTAAFRGALLIIVAVALGAGLLAKSFGTGGPTNTGGNPSGTTSTTVAGTTSTTQPVAHDPATVKVLVLNGVDPSKAIAKPAADALKAANYVTLSPNDAKTTVKTTAVYFQPGFEADAQAIATKLGAPATAVQPLPTPLPPTIDAAGDASVIAVIGPDSTFGTG